MKINFNMSALIANSALSDSDKALSKSLERLSSGLKINHAKDNAAGLAIAKRMNAQLEGLTIATQNASDGISVIETAEGALGEIQSMVQRVSELSVQAATGSVGVEEKQKIDAEVLQLKEEITRIAEQTEFNGQGLLNGDFDLKGYSNVLGVSFEDYSDNVPIGKYTFEVDELATFNADGSVNTNATVRLGTINPNPFPAGSTAMVTGNIMQVTGPDGFEMRVDLSDMVPPTPGNPTQVTLEATGVGAMRLQIGANEGQLLKIRIPTVSLKNMHLEDLSVATSEGALAAMDNTAYANNFISQVRSRLGAYQNRLEHSTTSLDVTHESMTAAYSRIMDVDMATEMTEYTKLQVMTQAGTSMLAQANERPQKVLQLLQ